MIETHTSYSLLLMILTWSSIGLHSTNGSEKNVSYVQTLSRQLGDDKTKSLNLSYRYLIFPLGSSIQVLWDQDIYISNYGQYLLTGMTVALAWELPSQPTYPEWEQVGTPNAEPESSSSMENQKYVNSSEPNQTIQSENSAPNQKSTRQDQEVDFKNHVRNYYEFLKNSYQNQFDKNLLKNREKSTDIIFPYSPDYNASNDFDAFAHYMIRSYFEPWFDWEQRRFTTTTIKTSDTRRSDTKMLNTVYPAMKKRYMRSASTSQEDIFYLNYHRKTRQNLYAIIEKYLFAKSLNGTACVMKAICEVNERRHQTQPGPFLAEIFRVIFSLPVPHLHTSDNKRHIKYDEANQSTNCFNKYENCPGSVWDVEFPVQDSIKNCP